MVLLRILFSFLLFIHGLIHLMGVAQEWNLTKIEQLSGKTLLPIEGNIAKVMGLLWLVTCLLFLLAIIGFLWKKEAWWIPAGIGIVLSQLLVIIYWPDAKAGTIANVLILLPVIIAYGSWQFNQMAEKEISRLLTEVRTDEPKTVTEEMLTDLPVCVQKWLRESQVVGKKSIKTVKLQQTGQMRLKPDGSWMPVNAVQYFTTEKPAFIWKANIQAASWLHISGRDKYQDGQGNMLIKLLSLVPVANASGSEIDQGTLMRYLAEIIWFPTVALSDYIQWEDVDELHARANINYGGLKAYGIFSFNENGEVISFEGPRYYEQNGQYSLENWFISVSGYQTFEGIRIPTKGKVTWKLDSGDFTWYELEVSEVDYE